MKWCNRAKNEISRLYRLFSILSIRVLRIYHALDGFVGRLKICVSLSVTSIIYTTVSIRRARRVSINDLGYLILLNVATAMAFVCFYVAIAFVPGSIASLIEAAVGPLWFWIKYAHLQSPIATTGSECGCGGYGMRTSRCQDIESSESHAELLGLCLAALAGRRSGAGCLIFQEGSVEGACSVILAHRFHLYVFNCCRLLTWHGQWLFEPVLNVNGVLVVLIGVIIPDVFSPIVMQSAEPVVTMLCLSLVPVITSRIRTCLW